MGVPISNVTRRVVYAASGTGPYNFTFEILANTDIAVYKDDTLLTLTTDYTVVINANGTGNITLTASPTGATQIAIVGNRTISRATDFVTGGDFFANTLNDELDQQTIFAQQNAEGLQRALQAPQTDPTSINMTLPRKADRAGKYLAFDANGNPQPGPSSTDVSTVAAIASDIVTVSGIASNVTTVASNNSRVTTVANNISNVNTVGGISSNVTTVAGIASNVTSVAGNATNINTVAGVSSNVTTVAGISTSVTSVAGNSTNIDNVATNIGSVISNANNMTAIQNAQSNATNAALSAASAAASAAAASAVALGNEPVRHSVRPSLLLDFANTKQLDPRITFTRASTATYYDGVTTAKAQENLLLYSESFDNGAGWATSNSSVTMNTDIAPDGTLTADRVQSNLGAPFLCGISSVAATFLAAQPLTVSVFAKAGSANFLQILIPTSVLTGGYANFNLSTGAVGNFGGTGLTASIISVGNSWYRCVVSIASVSASATNAATFRLVDSATAARDSSFSSSSSTMLFWGAQLEQRSSVTPYTATTTQAIINYVPVLQTAASGVARFDHNSTTGESLGLLIEEARTNLLTYSEQLDNAAWLTGSSVSVTANTAIAPDGTLTADAIVIASGASSFLTSITRQVVTKAASAIQYTHSAFFKALGATTSVRLYDFGSATNSGVSVFVSLVDGSILLGPTISGGIFTGASVSVTPVANGWYRVALTYTTDTATSLTLRCFPYAGTSPFTGDGYSGLLMWGAQLEAGAFATSYIPTTSAQVTRAADVASMTGTNFSSWYSANNTGSFYSEFNETFTGSSSGPWWLNNGTTSRGIAIRRSTTTNTLIFVFREPSGSSRDVTVTNAIPAGASNKVSVSFDLQNSSVSVNGATVSTAGSSTLFPIVDQLRIGYAQVAGSAPFVWCGTIKKLAYYPKRLTDAELQGLTTV